MKIDKFINHEQKYIEVSHYRTVTCLWSLAVSLFFARDLFDGGSQYSPADDRFAVIYLHLSHVLDAVRLFENQLRRLPQLIRVIRFFWPFLRFWMILCKLILGGSRLGDRLPLLLIPSVIYNLDCVRDVLDSFAGFYIHGLGLKSLRVLYLDNFLFIFVLFFGILLCLLLIDLLSGCIVWFVCFSLDG